MDFIVGLQFIKLSLQSQWKLKGGKTTNTSLEMCDIYTSMVRLVTLHHILDKWASECGTKADIVAQLFVG